MKRLLAAASALSILAACAAFPPPAMAAPITPPSLPLHGTLSGNDLLVVWATGTGGPLDKLPYNDGSGLSLVDQLGGVGGGLGLASGAFASTGNNGHFVPFLDGSNNVWANGATWGGNLLAPLFGASAPLSSIAAGGTTVIGGSGTVVCKGGHRCDDISGTLTVQIGLGPPPSGTGTIATLHFAATHTHWANCGVTNAWSNAGANVLADFFMEVSAPGSAAIVDSAIPSNGTYNVSYACLGGN